MQRKPSSELFWELAKQINYKPHEISFFEMAFDVSTDKKSQTHTKNYGYSAMATVGDGVLKLIVSEYFYNKKMTKMEITQYRELIEKDETLAWIAKKWHFEKLFYDGPQSDPNNTPPSKEENMGGVFEAVVFAIYKDHGLNYTKEWVANFLIPEAAHFEKNLRKFVFSV
jgi:dsRNA-specific ribonuclease